MMAAVGAANLAAQLVQQVMAEARVANLAAHVMQQAALLSEMQWKKEKLMEAVQEVLQKVVQQVL